MRVGLAAALALVFFVGGCVGSTSDLESPPDLLVRGFAAGGLSNEARASLHDAMQSALSSCMAAEGFEYVVEPFVAVGAPIDSPRELVLMSAVLADGRAYGIADDMEYFARSARLREDDPLGDLSPAERDAYWLALYGGSNDHDDDSAPGGCVAEADRRLAQERHEYLSLAQWARVEALLEDYVAAFERHATVEFSTWSACMHAAGYEVNVPREVRELAAAEVDAAAPDVASAAGFDETDIERFRAVERRIAADDAACQQPLADRLNQIDRVAQEEAFGALLLGS